MVDLTYSSSVKMSISLSSDIKDEVDRYSTKLGVSRSGFITQALKYYLDSIDLLIVKDRAKNPKII